MLSVYSKKLIFTNFIICFLLTLNACYPPRDANKISINKENSMHPYPMLFADFQKTSFQEQTPASTNEQIWFTEIVDDPSRQEFPRVILVSDKGLFVEYSNNTKHLDFNGAIKWQKGYGGFPSCSFILNSALYFSGVGGASIVNPDNGDQLRDFYIFTADETVHLLYPVDNDHFFAHTFTQAPFESEPGETPPEDESSIILMRSEQYIKTLQGDPDDWEYIHKLKEKTLPGLLTNDLKNAVVVTNNGTINTFTIDKGKKVGIEEHPGVWPLGVSLDKNNNLLILHHTPEGSRKLACYPLQGKDPLWEVILPGTGEIPLPQPPAIGKEDRIYCMVENTLCAVDNGVISWQYGTFAAKYFHYLTVLADNSILVTSANKFSHIDKDGNEIFFKLLPPGEDISTPPVIDAQGRFYFGTIKGIYCFG